MSYLLIYFLGFLLTLGLLILLDEDIRFDWAVLLIVSFTWPLTIPLKITFKIYYFFQDIYIELFKENPDEDPWEEALRDYRDLPHPPKPEKKQNQFKFGR